MREKERKKSSNENESVHQTSREMFLELTTGAYCEWANGDAIHNFILDNYVVRVDHPFELSSCIIKLNR